MRITHTITRLSEYLGLAQDGGQTVLTLGDPRAHEVELRMDARVWAWIIEDWLLHQGRVLQEEKARLTTQGGSSGRDSGRGTGDGDGRGNGPGGQVEGPR